MKAHTPILLLHVLVLFGCTAQPQRAFQPSAHEDRREPPANVLPSSEEEQGYYADTLPSPEEERAISTGWPFPVRAVVNGFDKPPNYVENIRSRFLQPLTQSRIAGQIAAVEIDVEDLEWRGWTCTVRFKHGKAPVYLDTDGAFYNPALKNPCQGAVRRVLDAYERREQR